jgi:hypothetical protein
MAYKEQLDRARRSLNKLEKLSALRLTTEITVASTEQDEYQDALYHFFQDCWHVKDWITHVRSSSSCARRFHLKPLTNT